MAASTAKKVIIRRFDRENLNGFINPYSYLQPEAVELLRQDGSLVPVSYSSGPLVLADGRGALVLFAERPVTSG